MKEYIELPAVQAKGVCLDCASGAIVTPEYAFKAKSIEIDSARVQELIAAAREASKNAYAPFSKFRVGAAIVMADDPEKTVFTGGNVENSSYPVTLCAERSALVQASAKGFRTIEYCAVSIPQIPAGAPVGDRSPCGSCRQALKEFSDEKSLFFMDNQEEGTLCEVLDIDRLLPFGFRFEGPA